MRKVIMPSMLTMLLALALLGSACTGGPMKAEQILFVIDSSSSMTERAGYPEDPAASRWQVVQRLAPQWLSRVPGKTMVGAVSVGGTCDGDSAINFRTGADRSQITAAIAAGLPYGGTPLNAVLKGTPSLFATGIQGGKRIALFSDGLNTCPPDESTCEIVRALHRDHGIVVDVIAWVTEPSMVNEFKCVTEASGGTFIEPTSLRDLVDLPFLNLDPWRYVVLALGLMTLILSSLIMYRHGYYAMNWSTRTASTVATVTTAAGALALYVVLFVRTGWIASLIGLIVVIGVIAVARSRSNRASARSFSPAAGIFLVVSLAAFPDAARGQAAQCARAVHGPARYHHILALDMSGTVAGSFNEMKALVACYAEMYTLPGEEISLVSFGIDTQGSAREVTTFTVPQSRSTDTLRRTLDDLEIQNAAQTRTYFKPLADFFNQRLKTVRLEPVVLVVSDGKSDALQDSRLGRVSFHEIPFESFGKRGIYAAPGAAGWRVAVQGGTNLDLALLFKQRMMSNNKKTRLSAPIEECLVDPDLLFETGDEVILQPSFNPFSSKAQGTLALKVRNDCVSRFRSFRVELRRGDETQILGAVSNMSINPEPSDLSFSFQQAQPGMELSEAVVQLVLDQGDTERTIYTTKPSRIMLRKVSYISEYGLYWGGGVVGALLLSSLFVAARTRRRAHEKNHPQLIEVTGGSSYPLGPAQRVEIGGPGCALQAPGVPEGVILASIESTPTKGKLNVQPADGFRMKVNGFDSTGSSDYLLGTPLQFISNEKDGATYDVTLHPASGAGTSAGGRTGGSFSFPSLQDLGHAGSAGPDSLAAGGSEPYI